MGKVIDVFASRFTRCGHVHVSGRRCGSAVLKTRKPKLCDTHLLGGTCSECRSMKASFVPPKGW